MTVQAFSGDTADFTIGLIACSRHQSNSMMPWAKHQPKLDFINPVQGGPAIQYLRDNLGYESTRYSRTYFRFWQSEQMTGHTALFVRIKGQAAWARGWVPAPSVSNYATALVGGGEVPGEWQDDLTMIDDPTCISLEYKVHLLKALQLITYWENNKATYTNYCFTVQGPGRCNCVWAAVSMLRDFAGDRGLGEIAARLAKVVDPAQGKLMGQIAGGELLMD